MPIYEYEARDPASGCTLCKHPFERIQRLSDPPLTRCPQCDKDVIRLISAPAVGASKSSFNDRAKKAGFHQLKKVGKGEYEKTF